MIFLWVFLGLLTVFPRISFCGSFEGPHIIPANLSTYSMSDTNTVYVMLYIQHKRLVCIVRIVQIVAVALNRKVAEKEEKKITCFQFVIIIKEFNNKKEENVNMYIFFPSYGRPLTS